MARIMFAALFVAALLNDVFAQNWTQKLVGEMNDLDRLTRLAPRGEKVIQFSSYDRRSTTPDRPDWFSNSDGFGGEKIPGFEGVLRAETAERPGEFLIADVKGPGAIVRGWSAGMAGVLRVYLDGAEPPIYEGDAYTFFARRSFHFYRRAVERNLIVMTDRTPLLLAPIEPFVQQDSDYSPLPFASRLRVTWEGRIGELHFYHLEVRTYPPGTQIDSFVPDRDAACFDGSATNPGTIANLDDVTNGEQPPRLDEVAVILPGRTWSKTIGSKSGFITRLALRVDAPEIATALRGTLMRIKFDGSSKPEVECPIGDFFGAAPGVHPMKSMPTEVEADGTMISNWKMPFEKTALLEFVNTTSTAVSLRIEIATGFEAWTDQSLHFFAQWRSERGFLTMDGTRPSDLLVAMIRGKGRYVGTSVHIMNPAPIPTPGGNWWGEGDEKIIVDDEARPSFFGTGSEDYFNYAWSRADLFSHPYCGQPVNSGPGTAGYVSNFRWHIADDIPFEKSLTFFIELWSHNQPAKLEYARCAYFYARPGAITAHQTPTVDDLKVAVLPKIEPVAGGGAAGSTIYRFEGLPDAEKLPERITPEALPIATRQWVLSWAAEPGETIKKSFKTTEKGKRSITIVWVHRQGAGRVKTLVDGRPIDPKDQPDGLDLSISTPPRLVNHGFREIELDAGDHTLTFECTKAGTIAFDFLWIK